MKISGICLAVAALAYAMPTVVHAQTCTPKHSFTTVEQRFK